MSFSFEPCLRKLENKKKKETKVQERAVAQLSESPEEQRNGEKQREHKCKEFKQS